MKTAKHRFLIRRASLLAMSLLPLALVTACEREAKTYMVGTLERDRIDLVVESNEPIVELAVVDGQAVVPGDPIIRQDPSRAQARLEHARGQRDQAAARHAELLRGPRQELIREARAHLESGRVVAENAGINLKRTQELFQRGLTSQRHLDTDQTRYDTTEADVRALEENLDRLLHGTTVEELDQARAAVVTAEATLSQAAIDLQRTQVKAPVSGIVDKVLYRLGERPAPGTTIAVILDSSRTYARIYVPEYIRTRVTPGVELDVRIDGEAQVYKGRVRWVSADASFTPYFALTEHDRSRLSYLAEVDVPEAQHLPSGVPLEVDLPAN